MDLNEIPKGDNEHTVLNGGGYVFWQLKSSSSSLWFVGQLDFDELHMFVIQMCNLSKILVKICCILKICNRKKLKVGLINFDYSSK